jgi:hypothetical protein
MIEAADFQSHNGQLVAIQPQHALIVLQEPPNGAPPGVVERRENQQLFRGRVHQRQGDLMFPRVLWRRVREARGPLCLIEVAELVARRHLEAVIEQAHNTLRRQVVAWKFNPADQSLRAEGNVIDVRLDVRAVVDRDEFVYLGRKLEQPPRHSTGDIF